MNALVLLCCWLVACDAYTAAVFESAPSFATQSVNASEALRIQLRNLAAFEQELQAVPALDIAVLGEYALYGTYLPTARWVAPYAHALPTASDAVNACRDAVWRSDSPVLAAVSCMARRLAAYVVVDLAERALCGAAGVPTPVRACVAGVDVLFFNTQVVVDRAGVLRAVYRKSHLYFEPAFDAPRVPDVVWFDTDFGERFGLLVCFDIMFALPATALAQLHGVGAFVYSTWWVDEAPLINGVQTQAAFADAFNAMLLAAGIGLNMYTSGSGIYAGAATLASTYNPTMKPRSQLLVAQLAVSVRAPAPRRRIPPPPAPAAAALLTSNYTVVPLAPRSAGAVSGAQGRVSCQFAWSGRQSARAELFALLVLDGPYNGLFPLSLCAVVRCATLRVASCNEFTLETTTVFDSWTLAANASAVPQLTWYLMTSGANGTTLTNAVLDRSGPSISSQHEPDAFLSATLWGLNW